jgi:deoxyribose-phosphate aldolase
MSWLQPPAHLSRADLARLIDSTLLKATSTRADIEALCEQAVKYKFWSVCVNPVYVGEAASKLRGSGTKVCTVIGFPLGSTTTATKLFESRDAVTRGAGELDMVSDIGSLKSGDEWAYFEDISQMVTLCHGSGVLLKVILECCYLTDDEKVSAARLAERAGADFVKTSTGFGPGGATVEDVSLLRRTLSKKVGVKAAGGIGTLGRALEMLKAGADRIGTSSGVRILEELPG